MYTMYMYAPSFAVMLRATGRSGRSLNRFVPRNGEHRPDRPGRHSIGKSRRASSDLVRSKVGWLRQRGQASRGAVAAAANLADRLDLSALSGLPIGVQP